MSSERQEYNIVSPWWGEHIHRYEEVIKNLTGSEKILDLACGNGYGTFLLANNTNDSVIGGDIDINSVNDCVGRFSKNNLSYSQLDGTNINYPDNTFDIVVSFETIEHTTKYLKMCKEFNRVLKSGGKLYLSTPNIKINSPTGKVENPYHTQEFTLLELRAIIHDSGYINARFFGQKYIRYSSLTIRNTLARILENSLYLKGIRKIPIKLQESLMKKINGKGHYPLSNDYALVEDPNQVMFCKTFFVIANKV